MRFLLFLVIFFPIISIAEPLISVPFPNYRLDPEEKVSAAYDFGDHPSIFCYDNTLGVQAFIRYPYQGQKILARLPLVIKNRGGFQGRWADPSGILTIRNDTDSYLIISCNYAL